MGFFQFAIGVRKKDSLIRKRISVDRIMDFQLAKLSSCFGEKFKPNKYEDFTYLRCQ
jgi:hypothetical protein